MAAEAIPLIKALLEAMGLTAAGSAKPVKAEGKEANKADKYARGAAATAAAIGSKNPIKAVMGVKDMIDSIHDDPYEGLSEEEKKKLTEEANNSVEGFGGEPDKDDKNNNDKKPPKPPVVPASKPRKELQLPEDYKELDDFNKSIARRQVADEGQSRWGRELVVDDSSIMGGAKHSKRPGMSDPEAVQISRERFMEGKPNSLDTDKAWSELKGQQKAKFRNRTVTQDAKDILEHQRAPEDTRMTNKALPDDQLKKALGLGVGTIIGGIANALPLAGADAYELDEGEMKEFLNSVNKYINSDDENDKAIGRAMMDSFLEDMGLTIDDLIAKESGKEPEKEPEKKESKKNKDSGIITCNVMEDTDGIIRR